MPLFRRNKIISNLDMIIECTDRLLSNWRAKSSQYIYCDILRQCQNLQLAIFGYIAYDYDFNTLDESNSMGDHELVQAIRSFLTTFQMVFYCPRFVSTIYFKLSRQHRKARATIERYVYKMMEQELAQSAESIAERKRTWLIASLIGSLRKDEQIGTVNNEKQKTGRMMNHIDMIISLTTRKSLRVPIYV